MGMLRFLMCFTEGGRAYIWRKGKAIVFLSGSCYNNQYITYYRRKGYCAMATIKLPASPEGIGKGLDHIESKLEKLRFQSKEIQEAMLLSEESMVRLTDNAPEGGEMHIAIRKRNGLAFIRISAPGAELTQESSISLNLGLDLENGDMGRGNEEVIRSMLLHSYADKIQYIRKGRYNFVEITAGTPERVFAVQTITALIAALLVGWILALLLPDITKQTVSTYVLDPIETVFVNCLKLATAPAVFFSIMSAFSQYASFFDPGRVSIRVLTGYICTSVLAILVGLGVFRLLQPGMAGQLALSSAQVPAASASQQPWILSTLVGIVPSNIFEPFLSMNTMQLIFLALVFGVAMGRAGEYSAKLRRATDALCALCNKATSLLMRCIPIATFASIVSVILNVGSKVLLSLTELIGTVLIGLVLMVLIYCMIIGLVGQISPLPFLRKYIPLMKDTIWMGSSANAIPKTIRCCKTALGVSPKVYSFSIPFGAMANMDGSCIYLTITALFMARMCGVELVSNDMIPLIFTIFVLSIGAPIAPGSAILCLTVLLSQIGASLTAVSILFGVNAVIEMLQVVSNTIGDVAITLVVAKSENLLDLSTYTAANRK